MSFWDAVVYGVIQGLSEFLPVSSSGHLALLPYVIKIQDPGVVFDLMMHLGTALAVVTYFRNDLLRYFRLINLSLFNFKFGGEDRWFVRNFIYSTFVSIFFILLFRPLAELARTPWVIIFNLAFFGGVLWFADWKNKKSTKLLDFPMTTAFQWKLAGMIGLVQSLAIFPGVSRSGITLTAALFLGMRRTEAGSYSFLLSLPIILAGILVEVPQLFSDANHSSLMVLITGVTVSFITGFLTIHYFMKLLKRLSLGFFAIYRWILALVMIYTLS